MHRKESYRAIALLTVDRAPCRAGRKNLERDRRRMFNPHCSISHTVGTTRASTEVKLGLVTITRLPEGTSHAR